MPPMSPVARIAPGGSVGARFYGLLGREFATDSSLPDEVRVDIVHLAREIVLEIANHAGLVRLRHNFIEVNHGGCHTLCPSRVRGKERGQLVEGRMSISRPPVRRRPSPVRPEGSRPPGCRCCRHDELRLVR